MPKGFTYITTNKSRTVLYIGVTSELKNRIVKHKEKFYPDSFSARYNCDILVFYREFDSMHEAIAFEKKIKGWLRKKKIALIESENKDWDDLYEKEVKDS